VFIVGVLRNTEPLDYAQKHNFILEVKAEDCGGRMSNKLLVNIVVKPACQNGWKGTRNAKLYCKKSLSVHFFYTFTNDLRIFKKLFKMSGVLWGFGMAAECL